MHIYHIYIYLYKDLLGCGSKFIYSFGMQCYFISLLYVITQGFYITRVA